MGLFDRLTAALAGKAPLPAPVREALLGVSEQVERSELDAAELALEALAGRAPEVAAVALALGQVRARRGDDDGAVTALGRAVALAPGLLDGWLELGEALGRLDRGGPAEEALRRVLAESPADDEDRRGRAHGARGRIALRAGRIGRAVRELRRAVDLLPEDTSLLLPLGRALRADEDVSAGAWLARAARAALAALGETEQSGPALVAAQVAREAAAALADHAAAIDLLEEVRARLEAVPSTPALDAERRSLATALALRLVQAGRPAEGLALGRGAVRSPSTAEADLIWVAALEAAGQHAEALAVARRLAPGALSPRRLVRLALGAGGAGDDGAGAALEAASRALPADDALGPALAAVRAGRADSQALALVAAEAPTAAARRFVARLGAPPLSPGGNLLGLLGHARELALRTPSFASLLPSATRAFAAFDRPLCVAIMGEFNAGKSSLVNALVGQDVAKVGATPTTATINVLCFGPPGGRVLYHDGRARELAPPALAAYLERAGTDELAAIRQVELSLPVPALRHVEIVDTPGWNALDAAHERTARAFLEEADAIVWIFSLGQAAKASERSALEAARAAGKSVLGLLNKVDQADPDEVEAARRHVINGLDGLVLDVVAVSTRRALAAERAADAEALVQSGLPAVQTALEARFFSQARALKRRTALGALRRFLADAEAAVALPAPPSVRDELAEAEALTRGALAALRITAPSRLESALRAAANEIRDLLPPRSLLDAATGRAEEDPTAERELVVHALQDALDEALAAEAAALAPLERGPAPVPVAACFARFGAYCRGLVAGGLADEALAGARRGSARGALEASLERAIDFVADREPSFVDALARRAPRPEEELCAPLEAAALESLTRARARADEIRRAAELAHLVHEEHVRGPLDRLAAAVQALEATDPDGAAP